MVRLNNLKLQNDQIAEGLLLDIKISTLVPEVLVPPYYFILF